MMTAPRGGEQRESGRRRASGRMALLLLAGALAPGGAWAQEAPLLWDAVKDFRYNILSASYDGGTRTVTVVFTVTNPQAGNAAYNVLSGAPPFKSPATLRVNVSWNSGSWGATELLNTGSDPGTAGLLSINRVWMNTTPASPGGVGTANPNVVNAMTKAKACTAAGSPCAGYPNAGLTFWVQSVLPAQAVGAGRVAVEGHPSLVTGVDAAGLPVYGSVPVKSVYRDFQITAGAAARRQVVEFGKCWGCHDGGKHGDVVVPRLSLHGANRNEEPGLCVMCHNQNMTDAAYRSSGAEESIDFKRMVHGIHAGGFRKTPLKIVGFRGTVLDFSTVRFPGKLRNCVTCHIDSNGKGTFELPIASKLGSTVVSSSQLSPLPGYVDVNPANDLRISPTAATCSACHDSKEVREHMTRTGGASFGVAQSVLENKERCVTCHGPGKEKSVRKAHEISSVTSTSRSREEEEEHER